MEELLLEMLQHYGLKEVYGTNSDPLILKMFHDLGYTWVKDDSTTAWCSAALNYFCKKLGYERSKMLTAKSWLNVGMVVTEPKLGDVVIFSRGDPASGQGHVGLFISRQGDTIHALGGNQSNGLNIAGFDASRVLGYRRLRKL